MVTYNYSLTSNGASSIQQVVNNITTELSTNPVITNDITIYLDSGNYAGFTIPAGALYPLFNTPYRLVIKPSGSFFPIIDFNYSDPNQVVGIDIGSGNPNVTIKGLRIQYFAVGIRASLNSHYPIVKDCIVNNNRNVNVLFEQCSEAQAIQNVIINGDYGIVFRLTKSAASVHNTIFQNGAISTEPGKSISSIWAELANDYGNGILDTGKLHLIGNIAWNTSGRCLTLFHKDTQLQGAIVSNFNDWVVGDPDNFIVIEDDAFFQGANVVPRQVINSLMSWKTFGYDPDSISQDPKFISAVRLRSGRDNYAIDLNLLPISPVLGLVPSFAFNSESTSLWIPAYVDSASLSKDIIRNNRSQTFTAAGSNEKSSISGFLGQDIFTNPLDLGLEKNCDVDPFSNVIYKELDLWFPKLKRGYFYSHDREYYLYSSKQTNTIGELAVTSFYLPAALSHNKEISVKVAGKKVSPSYFDIVKDKFILFHKDLPIYNKQEEIDIEGWISTWNGDSFIFSKTVYRLKISEGETKYLLPNYYVPIGPVVVTDDKSYPLDSDYIANREFSVSLNKEHDRSEIVFANNTNLISNSQFDYSLSGDPYTWESNLATVINSEAPHFSIAGGNVVSLENNGYVSLRLPISTGDPFVFSFHSRSQGSGDIHWTTEYYNEDFSSIGIVNTGHVEVTNEWKRYSIHFNSSGQDFNLDTPNVPYPCTYLTGYIAYGKSKYVTIQLKHIYSPAFTGNLLLDALQYEKTYNPTLYHRSPLLNELTVEFEGVEDDYFIDTRLSMSPATNLLTEGFLYIPEVPAATYGGPTSPSITTLYEWTWPEGRKNILPWARTKGKDKLRKRPYGLFNKVPQLKPEILLPVVDYAGISEIDITPSIPTAYAGDTKGASFLLKISDANNNPAALAEASIRISDSLARYPGALFKTYYGLKQKLGVSINAIADNAGMIPLTWIPPDSNAGVYRGSIPSPELSSVNGDRITTISTEYPVSLENYGNVTILDDAGNQINTFDSTPITEEHIPTLGSSTSSIRLRYPAKIGSVSVIIDGVRYSENLVNIIESNQFYVDYDNAIVIVKGRYSSCLVEYTPNYVFINQSNPYKIMLYYDKLFPSYTGSIVLSYDFVIRLDVTVNNYANSNTISRDFQLVAQNSLFRKTKVVNPLSLEF